MNDFTVLCNFVRLKRASSFYRDVVEFADVESAAARPGEKREKKEKFPLLPFARETYSTDGINDSSLRYAPRFTYREGMGRQNLIPKVVDGSWHSPAETLILIKGED